MNRKRARTPWALAVAAAVLPGLLGASAPTITVPAGASASLPAVRVAPPGWTAQLANYIEELPLLESLTVREPSGPDYVRAAFDYPIPAPGGCDTEHQALVKWSSPTPTEAGPCHIVSGQWIIFYNGTELTNPADVMIEHLVPLEDAWYSGAWEWTAAQRRDFANDTSINDALMITSVGLHAARGSSDPSRWLPPYSGGWCKYAQDWVAIKARWNLSVTPDEYAALKKIFLEPGNNCGMWRDNLPRPGLSPGRGPGAITGIIGAPSGTSNLPMRVEAYAADNSLAATAPVISARYIVAHLPPGTYTIRVCAGDNNNNTTDGWYDGYGEPHRPAGPPLPVTVTAGAITGGIDVAILSAPPLTDVATDPFHDEIHWLITRAISTGYPDGTYRPFENISRAAMAAFLYRMAGHPRVPADAPTFRDVPAGTPFSTEIGWLASQRISTGYPDGTYRPMEPVTRQAMAAFLYRLAGSPPAQSPAPEFTDVPPGSAFHTEISWFAANGVSTGYPDNTFHPTDLVHRDAMAAFLYRYATRTT